MAIDIFAGIDLKQWIAFLCSGLGITMKLGFYAFLLSLILGGFICWIGFSKNKLINKACQTYLFLIRGTPEILIIFFIYFSGAKLINTCLQSFGYANTVEISPFIAGLFSLSFVYSAYISEVFRGSVLAFPKGQLDAAKAFGFSKLTIFIRILGPQSLKLSIPALSNLWLQIIKDTALVSIIGLNDLFRNGMLASGTTHNPMLFLGLIALIFFILTYGSIGLFNLILKTHNSLTLKEPQNVHTA